MQRKWIWLACSLALALAVAPALVAQNTWVVSGDDDDDENSSAYSVFTVEDGAFLGVTMEEETDSDEGGARVTSVVDDSPAAKAGLKVGDVVIRFGGDTIRGPVSMTKKIRDRDPGDEVQIVVLRDGRKQTLDVELGERSMQWNQFAGVAPRVLEQLRNIEIPNYDFNFNFEGLEGQLEGMDLESLQGQLEGLDLEGLKNLQLEGLQNLQGYSFFGDEGAEGLTFDCEDGDCNYRSLFFNSGRPRLGVQLTEVTPELREHLGSDSDAGVLVSKVIEDSAAEDAGIEVGDLIVDVDGEAVADTDDLRRALAKREGETFEVEVIRDGRSRRLSVTLEIKEEDAERPTGPRALYRVKPAAGVPFVVAARVAPRVAALAPAVPAPPRAVAPTIAVAPVSVPNPELAPVLATVPRPSALVAPVAPAFPAPGALAAPPVAPRPALVPHVRPIPAPRAPRPVSPVLAGDDVI